MHLRYAPRVVVLLFLVTVPCVIVPCATVLAQEPAPLPTSDGASEPIKLVDYEEPVTEEPVTEEPVTEEPVTEEPVTEEPVAGESVEVEPDATAKREDVTEQLRVAQRVLDSAEKAMPQGEAAPEPLANEVKLLKQLEAIHAQRQAAGDRTKELQTASADLEGKLKVLRATGPSSEELFSFTRLETLRDQLALETVRTESLDASVSQHQQSLERAKTQHEEKESARRVAKEAVDTSADKAKTAELTTAVELAEIESNLAGETAKLRKIQRDNEQLVLETHQLQSTFLEESIALIAKEVVVTEEDEQERLTAVQETEDNLQWQRDAAQDQYAAVENRWTDARGRLDQAGGEDPLLVEEVASHYLALQVQQQTLEIVNQRLGRSGDDRTAWTHRFKLQQGISPDEDLIAWHDETAKIREQLDRELSTQSTRLADWRRESTALDKKFADTPTDDSDVARWRGEQQAYRQKLTTLYERNQDSIEASQQLHAKLLADLEGASGSVAAGIDWSLVTDRASKLWNYELLAIDDRPITPRKIATGLFLLILGIYIARAISRFLGRRVLSLLPIHPNAAHAIRSMTFYVLLFLVAFSSLHVANVPLATFTILGGALALGVGFGSQNIINNFISGLIILAEHPVRVGDLIEIDNCFGTVDSIGARSTRLRTGANLEIIVPNSHFLEQNVVNWTLSDTKVRSKVCIGVAYGSPTEQVKTILAEVANEHKYVLADPGPTVLFVDFAENTLNFEVRFWIRADQLGERLSTESDMRYEIDRRFREADISIAFPQRDIHLDMSGPMQVQMIDGHTAARPSRAA